MGRIVEGVNSKREKGFRSARSQRKGLNQAVFSHLRFGRDNTVKNMKIIVRSFEKKFVGSQDSTGLKGLNVAGTNGFTNNVEFL